MILGNTILNNTVLKGFEKKGMDLSPDIHGFKPVV